MNFLYRVRSLLGWAVVAACLMAIGGIIATVAHAGDYPMVTAILPAYGAGAAQSLSDPPPPEQQPEWAKRLEKEIAEHRQDTRRLLKLLEELDDGKGGDTNPPPAGAGEAKDVGDWQFSDRLTPAQEGLVVTKVRAQRMPPKSAPQLTPDERATLLAAFQHQKFDKEKLAAAGDKCFSCHGPTANDDGGKFQMFVNVRK